MPQAFTSGHFINSRLCCIQPKHLFFAILFILGQAAYSSSIHFLPFYLYQIKLHTAQAFTSCHFIYSRLGCIWLKHSLFAILFIIGQAAYGPSIHFLPFYLFQVRLHTAKAFTFCHCIYSRLGCFRPRHSLLAIILILDQAAYGPRIKSCYFIYSRLGCLRPKVKLFYGPGILLILVQDAYGPGIYFLPFYFFQVRLHMA